MNSNNNLPRPIELLAPAKNLEQGIIAIDHGADAVYIGANEFGARQAAGNSIEDITELAAYAHQFGARVYVTVNTIVYEHELAAAKELLRRIVKAGVDAILVQDMAVVEMMREIAHEPEMLTMRMPELHASTQTDNRSAEKAAWLTSIGFSRVVLARELSVDEIKEIHKAVPQTELEVFVHGALCVSYSGACYASHHCFGRSANRGECAQFCRLAFDLKDSRGDIIRRASHLLSLKDMNQLDRLEEIIAAGASSLKIEGRLKDAAYVKNVVAAYSQQLNKIIENNPGKYCRSSRGKSEYSFTPNLAKTFNRGFTHYFLDGRRDDISSFDTPKAMGEYVGYVKEIRRGSFNVAGTAMFANGDGLCFFTPDHKLHGFRVNRVENNRLFPLSMPEELKAGMALYRNNDMVFERAMEGKTAERKLAINFTIGVDCGKIVLEAEDEAGRKSFTTLDEPLQEAQKPQSDNIIRQLEKLGNTQFRPNKTILEGGVGNLFIPSSKLAAMRREVLAQIEEQPIDMGDTSEILKKTYNNDSSNVNKSQHIDAEKINAANVANHRAEAFYEEHGVKHASAAFELTDGARPNSKVYGTPHANTPLMTCRYCLRYAMGYCVKRGGKQPTWKEPLLLESSDGRQVRLVFNCAKCQMEVFAQD
mgnify:CR=1 FL=1